MAVTQRDQHKFAGSFILNETHTSREHKILAQGESVEAGTVMMVESDLVVPHDGSDAASAGIMLAFSESPHGTFPVVLVVRDAEVNSELLIYPEGAEENITAALAADGIKLRPDLAVGSGGGGEEYHADAVHFDGSSYLLGNGNLSASNSSQLTYSFWWKIPADIDFNHNKTFWCIDPADQFLSYDSLFTDGYGIGQLSDPADAENYLVTNRQTIPLGSWVWVGVCVDTDFPGNDKIIKIFFGDSAGGQVTIGGENAFDIRFNLPLVVGGDSFANDMAPWDAADFWFAPGQFIDFGVEANRRKFIDADGKPVDLGADGSTPTGIAPAVFFSGNASGFATNKGTGGAFTLTGSLTNASTSPSD